MTIHDIERSFADSEMGAKLLPRWPWGSLHRENMQKAAEWIDKFHPAFKKRHSKKRKRR